MTAQDARAIVNEKLGINQIDESIRKSAENGDEVGVFAFPNELIRAKVNKYLTTNGFKTTEQVHESNFLLVVEW